MTFTDVVPRSDPDIKLPSFIAQPEVLPERNSFMMASLSFCGMSPCMEETVKLASRIFSVSQSTCTAITVDAMVKEDRKNYKRLVTIQLRKL